MSFFGITALGPPNQFKSALVSALGINVFSEEEFKASFKRVDKDQSGYITADEVENFLFETYGFPPLEDEVSMFMKEFDNNQDGKVSWDEFSAALGRIKERVNQKATGAKEYKSFNKLRDDRYKHKRMDGEIQDKYKQPITFNQSIGFHH
jgi:Ca2+-binding EF-hand superfamily protein